MLSDMTSIIVTMLSISWYTSIYFECDTMTEKKMQVEANRQETRGLLVSCPVNVCETWGWTMGMDKIILDTGGSI